MQAQQTQRDQIVLRQAQAAVRSTSVALATLLRLDPTIYLDPAEHIVAPPTLVPLDIPVQVLVKDARTFRPELKASAAAISAAEQERLAAKYGPLIPSLTGQAIYGQIRGGPSEHVGDCMSAHQDLTQARNDYSRALTQYAKAQYALAHATARLGG